MIAKKDHKKKPIKKERKEFAEELLNLARVTRVVKGGRRLRFRATVAVGDRNGRVGIGTGKSAEVAVAVQKAVAQAKKSMLHISLTEHNSISHQVRIKFKSAQILMMPAFDGTGVKAGGVVRKIFDLVGIKNIIAKRFGTNNPLVNAQATILALHQLKDTKKSVSTPEAPENAEENEATEEKA